MISRPTIGIGQREPERDTASAEQHRQRREAVGAGVQAVGNQCGRTDSAADPDPVERHQLVADEAHEAGGGDPAHMLDLRRMKKPRHGFVSRDDGRQGDHRDHEEPGQVLGAAEAVGVAPRRGPGAERERDPQWHGRQRIGEVVNGVRRQRNRPGDHHDDGLHECGDAKRHQTDLDRANADRDGLQCAVDAVGGVVTVRNERVRHYPRAFRAVRAATSPRWWAGMPGPACSALNTASLTSWRTCSFSML